MDTFLRQLRDPKYIGQEGMRDQAAFTIEHLKAQLIALPALVKALEDVDSRLKGPANALIYDVGVIVRAALATYRKV